MSLNTRLYECPDCLHIRNIVVKSGEMDKVILCDLCAEEVQRAVPMKEITGRKSLVLLKENIKEYEAASIEKIVRKVIPKEK
jgi:hypothetical protein